MWLVLAATIGTILALARNSQARSSPEVPVRISEHTLSWKPLVAAELADPKYLGIPLEFVMRFMQAESDGNPCAMGNPDQFGPDGKLPREIGLGQMYNGLGGGNYFKRLGYNPAKFRAYCVPGTQRKSRNLTGAEEREQVRAVLDEVLMFEHDVAPHAWGWDRSHRDWWKVVKLQHALPVIVHPGFSTAAQKLGHNPANWGEFRDTYAAANPRARFRQDLADAGKEQDGFYRALANAEWTGDLTPAGAA